MTSLLLSHHGFSHTSLNLSIPFEYCSFVRSLIIHEDLRTPSGRRLSIRDFCYNLLLNELDRLRLEYDVRFSDEDS